MTLDDLEPGLRHSATLPVSEALSVPAQARIFDPATEMPPVFATAQMIAFVEWTCVAALAPYLGPDQRTVGTRVEMTHTAATPIDKLVKEQRLRGGEMDEKNNVLTGLVVEKSPLALSVNQNPRLGASLMFANGMLILRNTWKEGLDHKERMKAIPEHHVLCYKAEDGKESKCRRQEEDFGEADCGDTKSSSKTAKSAADCR